MSFIEETQRLRHLRNGFSESARNSELETIFKPFGLRHVIKSGSSHRLVIGPLNADTILKSKSYKAGMSLHKLT